MLFVLVASIYAAWLILTCINQRLLGGQKWLIRMDIFQLIPVWTFFAPNPGVTDYNLLVRYRLSDGTITPFEEIPTRQPFAIGHLLFHPDQRLRKALIDHIVTIETHVENGLSTGNEQAIRLSAGYIRLLYYCTQITHPENAAELQFLVLESFGYLDATEPRLMFNSEFHKL